MRPKSKLLCNSQKYNKLISLCKNKITRSKFNMHISYNVTNTHSAIQDTILARFRIISKRDSPQKSIMNRDYVLVKKYACHHSRYGSNKVKTTKLFHEHEKKLCTWMTILNHKLKPSLYVILTFCTKEYIIRFIKNFFRHSLSITLHHIQIQPSSLLRFFNCGF